MGRLRLALLVSASLALGTLASAAPSTPRLSREFVRRARFLASEEMTDAEQKALDTLMQSGYLARLYEEWRKLEGCDETKPSADTLGWRQVERRVLEVAGPAGRDAFGADSTLGDALPARVGPARESSDRFWVVPVRSGIPGDEGKTLGRVVVDVSTWKVDRVLR